MTDPEDPPIKAPAPYRPHREHAHVVKRPPEEMKAHMLRVLSEHFGKVDSLEDASSIARLNIQLTGGGND